MKSNKGFKTTKKHIYVCYILYIFVTRGSLLLTESGKILL